MVVVADEVIRPGDSISASSQRFIDAMNDADKGQFGGDAFPYPTAR